MAKAIVLVDRFVHLANIKLQGARKRKTQKFRIDGVFSKFHFGREIYIY